VALLQKRLKMKRHFGEDVKTGVYIIGALVGLCFVCAFLYEVVLPLLLPAERENGPRCSSFADMIDESKLIGTWFAGNPDHSDTLIIKDSGLYKQLVHIEFPEQSPIDYESDWQSWHLEYSEENIGYLHLDGMSFCGMNSAISCSVRDGGGYDFCRDEYLPMNDEGILLVLGTPNQESIFLFYPLGSENSYVYSKQEP
jgi:hypothetical protein